MVELTYHAYQRAKERKIGDKSSIYQNVEKAYENGKNIEDFNKEIRKYLTNTLKNSNGNMIKVYGNFVYIFFNNILITLFPLSQKLIQNNQKNSKR